MSVPLPLSIGHQSLGDTGVTAIVPVDPEGMRAAVDVRGGGPGTRETDLLEPYNTVEKVGAILLCGGSAFGLAAADGAMRELEEHGRGFQVFGDEVPNGPVVPIVPAAVIFDLVVGDPAHRPVAADGAAAVRAALESQQGELARGWVSGSVGAGCGATAGVLRGGFGVAQQTVGEYTVAAFIVANPVGSVIDPHTGLFYGDSAQPSVDTEVFAALKRPTPKLNTTIGVIATDAPLDKAHLKRLAMTGHDGIARAVRPAHSPLDGDTLFAVSVGGDGVGAGVGAALDVEKHMALGEAAATCVETAIVNAVMHAEPAYGVRAWREVAS